LTIHNSPFSNIRTEEKRGMKRNCSIPLFLIKREKKEKDLRPRLFSKVILSRHKKEERKGREGGKVNLLTCYYRREP